MQKLFKIYISLSVCLLSLLFNVGVVKGGTPVVHVSAKPTWLSVCKAYDKRPSARTIEKGFFYTLIEEQIHVEKQADYHHVIKEIVSETGIQNASQISVAFDPSFERLDFHDIIIWRDGKPLNRLNTSKFKVIADEQDLSNFIYQGSYSALCILDDIRKGDRIEYSYTITGRNPIFNGKYCDEVYFQWYYPIAHQYAVIITSSQRKLNIKNYNNVPKAIVSESNGLKRYEYEAFQIAPARDDDNQPDWYNTKPYIQISEYNDWAGIVNWALSINPTATNIKGELGERIAKLKAKAGNDKEKYFREAVKTVQDEVRYMGIEIGQYSHRANNPERVFKQRYGDCKDKSLLLVSMLKANGIDASMVLVNSSIKAHIADYIPTYHAFDHAVVVANLNSKQVWVDATIDYQGGTGTDIYFPNYGKGLILKEGNTSLTDIPSSKAGKIFYEDTYKIKDEKSPVTFTVKTTYTLNEADDVRSRLASSGMAETEKNYLEYYGKIYSKIEPKDSITVNDDLDKNILTTTETYLISNYFRKDSATNKYAVDLYANYISQQFPSFNGQTKTPVSISYPLNIDYTIRVILPGGWDITDKNNEINRDYFHFASHYTSSGDTLSLAYSLKYLKNNVPVNKLGEFKDDIKQLNDNGLGYSFTYNPGTDAASAPSNVNTSMVIFAMLLTIGLIFLGVYIYQRETPAIVFSYGATFTPLGGWLILVSLILIFTTFFAALVFLGSDYFSLETWNLASPGKQELNYKLFIIMEVFCFLILLVYSIYCLILLISKRDILPKAIIGYFAFTAGFVLIDLLWTFTLKHNKMVQPHPYVLIYSVIVAAIGIPYFKRSSRVEHTFIVPYPPYNYSYEGPEAQNEEMKNH